MKYDFYVADNAKIPHVGVDLADDPTALIAMFLIETLTLDQATTLAMDLVSRLNANGHGS